MTTANETNITSDMVEKLGLEMEEENNNDKLLKVEDPDNDNLLKVKVPVGHWRDGLCACCRYGFCYPMFWLALCLPPLALGQIMTRMNLTFLATRGPSNKTFCTICIILFVYWFIMSLFSMYIAQSPDTYISLESYLQSSLHFAFWLYCLIITIRTRQYIRKRCSIPTTCCGCLEDCCCAFFCGFCTITQMARHTADYDIHTSFCCTKNGLFRDTQIVVEDEDKTGKKIYLSYDV